MKILFAGPTLHDAATAGQILAGTDIVCRAPARQGDITRAVLDGATAIGLVDGRYEDVAAPWHKEILFALSRGVAVLGGASMGALRAAECAPYGMVPVGRIADRYVSGDLTDDAAVAQLHAPPEFGCLPLTEALVNVEATIEAARSSDALSAYEAGMLARAARRLFFKERTYAAVVKAADFAGEHAKVLLARMGDCRRDIKREDALELVDALSRPCRCPGTVEWSFAETATWRRFIRRLQHGEGSS